MNQHSNTLNDDKEVIQFYSDNIELNDNTKLSTKGSLFELFTSSFFNINSILYYLNKTDSIGIIDFLMNQLATFHLNASFLYLPQLIAIISNKDIMETLEHFLLNQCIDQIKFSLLAHWLVLSNNSSGNCKRKFELNRIEYTLVNGHEPFTKQYSNKKLKELSKESIMNYTFTKELRLNYFNKLTVFYDSLKLLCESLKEITANTINDLLLIREQRLLKKISQFNAQIESMYLSLGDKTEFKHYIKDYYRGIILPFDLNDINTIIEGEDNNIIVNILPQYSFCFNTKARVPVKLVVECVRVYECEDWDTKFINSHDDKINSKRKPTKTNSDKVLCYNSINDFLAQLSIEDNEVYPPIQNNQSKEGTILRAQTTIDVLTNTLKSNSNDSTSNSDNNHKIYLSDTSGTSLQIKPFGQKWSEVISDIKSKSSFRNFHSYSVKSFIVKANDDLRQELLTMQLIRHLSNIFKSANIPLSLFPFEILITSPSSGLIEFLPNTISIDSLKKQLPKDMDLNNFFRKFFFDNFEEAQKNFAESLAGYSLITYLLDIKDRHNGNILLDLDGHIIHIDFGFILGISPKNLNFEKSPFKLTNEYVDILDGSDSYIFDYFKSLMTRGFREIRNHYESCAMLIEIMSQSWDIPCFNQNINELMIQFKRRFHFNISEFDYQTLVNDLVNESLNNWRTVKYDSFQKYSNNIMP